MHITFSNGMPDAKPQIIPLELPAPQPAPGSRGPQTLPAILRTLAAIDAEGTRRDPAYYAGIANLGAARIRLAKALLRLNETERMRRLGVLRIWSRGETVCCFCMNAFHTLASVVECGGRLLHGECYQEHNREIASWIHSQVEITDAGRAALDEPSDAA